MLHRVPAERIEIAFRQPGGLTQTQASTNRARFGSNDIIVAPPSGWRHLARDTARDPMIWFLVATSLLFAGLGDYVEAAILAVALLPITGIDAYLHRRTQASTEGLAGQLAAQAHVLREGVLTDIPSADIVPGDVVVVRESESFPADGVLIASENVQVDESALTGEALPVRKQMHTWRVEEDRANAATDEHAIAHESWGAAGTRMLTGEARLYAVFTGAETLYGQIVRSAQSGTHERTQLQQALSSLVIALIAAASLMCIALAATRYLQGHGLLDALLSAVTLAVAALPEEFPIVFTFFLSIGVYRLARRSALVRRAVAVENIGRVTCICSDKTGTLTEGRLELAHLLPADTASEERLLMAAVVASRAGSNDPMDRAVHARGRTAVGERLATFPFTEDRRREVGVARHPELGVFAAGKGAPETILGMTTLSQAERDEWLEQTRALASTGYKVIACAARSLDQWHGGEPDRDYTFLGLLAFEDPVRPTAGAAVKAAQTAGIRVIMVTGDHPATAAAIAAKLGIGTTPPRVIDGSEWPEYLRADRAAGFDAFDVIARCIPMQKLELVQALRAAGETVAVTGDGVNDVPALQGADIGIAMGERGTRSAREVASIVLLDDDFRTIIVAISEGRQLFENLKRSFAYLLMVHIPLVLTAAFIPFAGYPLLYLPVHIVWLELLLHPTALLVFPQRARSDQLAPIKRGTHRRFFDRAEWALIAIAGLVITMFMAFGYVRSLGPNEDIEHARSMALVLLIVSSATVTLGLGGLRARSAVLAAGAAVLSAILFVQVDPLAQMLHLNPLHADDWLIAALVGLLPGALAWLLSWRSERGRVAL